MPASSPRPSSLRSRLSRAYRALSLGLRWAAAAAVASVQGRSWSWSSVVGLPSLPAARAGATVPGEEYREGLAPMLLGWSRGDVDGAITSSAQGNLSRAADLCLAMNADDRIPAVRKARVMAVSAAPLTFEAAASGRLRRRALKAAEAQEDWWDMVPEPVGDELRDWRRFFGVALGELVWVEPDPADPTGQTMMARIRHGRNVPRLKVWNPRNLRLDPQTLRWTLRLKDGSEISIEPGDGKWVVLTLGGSQPWLKGPWMGVASLWVVKHKAINSWSQQGSKAAGGSMVWVTGPDGLSTEERDAEAAALAGLLRKSPVVVSSDPWKADVKELKGQNWQTYESIWTRCDLAIAVAVLLSDLSTEGKKGVGTGANLQRDNILSRDMSDAEGDATDFREQIMKPWALVNFGDADVAPWLVWHVEPPEDKASMASLWNLTANAMATARKSGIGVELEEIRTQTGFPITGEIDPIPAAPAPFAGAPRPEPKAAPEPPPKAERPEDIAAEAEKMARVIGLSSALDLAAKMRGAPLSRSELRLLAKQPVAVAARELGALFADRRDEMRELERRIALRQMSVAQRQDIMTGSVREAA